jgi:serine/threonine-protein kinase
MGVAGQQILPGIQIGAVLAGKYRIDRLLGEGGMGVVVAAYHVHLDERVAIKFLRPEIVQNREIVVRFLREARAAIKIKSEHVSRVTDVGTLENGAPYMVMEFLDGRDVANLIAERGSLSIEETVEFVLQACEALAEAHALKMVHRDLKPANLFVVRRADGLAAIRVLDFGISKMSNAAAATGGLGVTKTSDIMGSPLYMAPEQMLASHDVDMRSDIWSLGVVIHEMITGKVPFDGETVPAVCAKILRDEPEPMSRRKPGVPSALDRIVLRCLSKERDARYQNVAELANALVEFGPRRARASAERITRIIDAAGIARSPTPSSDPMAGTGPTLPPERRPAAVGGTVAMMPQGVADMEDGSSVPPSSGSARTKVYVAGAVVAALVAVTIIGFATRRSPPALTPEPAAVQANKIAEPSPPPGPRIVPAAPVAPAPPAVAEPKPVVSASTPTPVAEKTLPPRHREHRVVAAKLAAPTENEISPAPKPMTAKKPTSGSTSLLDLMDDRK